MKVLITGGTVFVSRYMAEYFVARGHEVFVMNRNTRPQPREVKLIRSDRHSIGDKLRGFDFDAVIDVNAYNGDDVIGMLDALKSFQSYVLISSSAVYPETAEQPFKEDTPRGANRFWGEYGLGKLAAENALLARVPNAYIIRPPYIYGEYNNVYREAFVFDCADADRPFYLPGDGSLPLQFIHVEDVGRFVEALLETKPEHNIYNVGTKPVTARRWVEECYAATGKTPDFVFVDKSVEQRSYFPFHAYAYELDCSEQNSIMPNTIALGEGLERAYRQYTKARSQVKPKDYLKFIEKNL